MRYHADRSNGRGYTWKLTAAENQMMMRLRGLEDGMHLVTVRKVAGRVAGVAVLSAQEEEVGGGETEECKHPLRMAGHSG